jgi:hypothetical protein
VHWIRQRRACKIKPIALLHRRTTRLDKCKLPGRVKVKAREKIRVKVKARGKVRDRVKVKARGRAKVKVRVRVKGRDKVKVVLAGLEMQAARKGTKTNRSMSRANRDRVAASRVMTIAMVSRRKAARSHTPRSFSSMPSKHMIPSIIAISHRTIKMPYTTTSIH